MSNARSVVPLGSSAASAPRIFILHLVAIVENPREMRNKQE